MLPKIRLKSIDNIGRDAENPAPFDSSRTRFSVELPKVESIKRGRRTCVGRGDMDSLQFNITILLRGARAWPQGVHHRSRRSSAGPSGGRLERVLYLRVTRALTYVRADFFVVLSMLTKY